MAEQAPEEDEGGRQAAPSRQCNAKNMVQCNVYHSCYWQYGTMVGKNGQKGRLQRRLKGLPVHKEPVAKPVPEPESDSDVHDVNLEAVKDVACVLAQHHEQGFQHIPFTGVRICENVKNLTIPYKALLRMALIADHNVLNPKTVSRAAVCGGVKPQPPLLAASSYAPNLANAHHANYETVINRLLKENKGFLDKERSQKAKMRIEYIQQLGQDRKRKILEAALAAADYAYKEHIGQELTWDTLQGGAWAPGDLPT